MPSPSIVTKEHPSLNDDAPLHIKNTSTLPQATPPPKPAIILAPAEMTYPSCGYMISPRYCDRFDVKAFLAQQQAEAKEFCLADGSDKAREILTNRHDMVSKTGNFIHKANKHVSPAGVAFSMVASFELVSPLLAVAGTTIHFVNDKVMAANHERVETALNAIKECNDPELKFEDKRKSYETLVKTAHSIRRWEKTEKIGGMFGQILFAHIGEWFAIAVEAKDLILDACERKEQHKPSETLMEAIIEMGDALGLHEPDETSRLYAPVTFEKMKI